jgi:outer membrane protein OmpA-like peptidoglycan-associated protein
MNGILRAGLVAGYHWHPQTGWVQLMAFFGCGGQPRDAVAFVQAAFVPWLVRMPVLGLVCLLSLAGCSNNTGSSPVGWWDKAVGGKVAEQRPSPPGSNDPYPNLATVPAKPAAPNTAEWNQRTTGLVTDRIKADQAAALAPIPTSVAGSTPSGTGLPSPAAPGQEPAASAALVGVTPPQSASGPGAPNTVTGQTGNAPRASGPRASLPADAGAANSAAPGWTTAERVANGQLPALPAEAPTRAGIAPPPPPPVVPVTVTPPFATQAAGTDVDFSQNSAVLNDPTLAEVKALAAARGDHGIAITGYGGATSSDPVAQSDALSLGLSRAQALATALVAQGVPYAMLRLNAEAAGRGASLRLLQ